MLSIFESERFQKDLENYQKIINSIDNVTVKNQCENFLNKLILEVKKFDHDHEQMIFSKDISKNPPGRNKIVEFRKILEKKIKEYKDAKFKLK